MKRKNPPLDKQMKKRIEKGVKKKPEYDGNTETMISTGSTLLDLEISGGRVKEGGIPGGILVEIYGPSSTMKTVLLSEIAGAVQRQGGEIKFMDPEGRLNKQFARQFDLNLTKNNYSNPDTVPEVFAPVRDWKVKDDKVVNGIFADSFAALSTDMEMDDKDKRGQRRAKEFSEQCRKTCRILSKKNLLMVGSNQMRANQDNPYQKFTTPGGYAVGYYASLRLETRFASKNKKLKTEKIIKGSKTTKIYGVSVIVKVEKSSVWRPFGEAPVYLVQEYGIDDIRANLEYLKRYSGKKCFVLGDRELAGTLPKAIEIIEEEGLERRLKKHTVKLWHEIDKSMKVNRKKKRRF